MPWTRFRLTPWLTVALVLTVVAMVVIDLGPAGLRSWWTGQPARQRWRQLTKITDWLYLPWLPWPSTLPSYHLEIPPADLEQLLTSTPPVYSTAVYTRSQQAVVAATVTVDGVNYPVAVRIHGGTYPHWSQPKKSWRLEFTNQPFQGYSELTLLLPETRGFILESLSQHLARKLNLIARDTWFVQLTLNGAPQGVYLAEEHWTKDVLEKNRRNSDADLFGQTDAEDDWLKPDLFQGVDTWKKYAANPDHPENFAAIQTLTDLVAQADPDIFSLQAQSLIDLDSFARWQAHSLLLPTQFQNADQSFRLYFNRDSGQFEFLPYDISTPEVASPSPANRLVEKLLALPAVRSRRDQIIRDYMADSHNLDSDLKFYYQSWNKLRFGLSRDLYKAYSTLFASARVWEYRQILLNHWRNLGLTL